jgi:hypothetical protein
MSLNGLSPRRSNPRRGFDLMKIGCRRGSCPGAMQNARRVGASLTLTTPCGPADRIATRRIRGAGRIAPVKTAPKLITAVDNAMTAA